MGSFPFLVRRMLKNGHIFIARIHTFYDLKCQQLKQYYDEERTGRERMGGAGEVKNGIKINRRWGYTMTKRQQKGVFASFSDHLDSQGVCPITAGLT